jgi:RNA polymerase sigma factor (sigma-70 family)
MATPELQEFLAVLRSGDPQAVDDLLRQLDPFLRRIIRQRLIDGRLRRVMDTGDIFQSLLKDFLSQRKSSDPGEASAELRAYLAAAVHHKIQTRARKERRSVGSLPGDWEPVSREPPASERVEEQDLSRTILARLPEEKRRLFDLKRQGLTWAEIAKKVGGKPDALRMGLNRAIASVLSELRYEDSGHVR